MKVGTVLAPSVSLRSGDYADLRGAAVVVITAGANEKAGGATDRNDPAGGMRLLGTNAAIYRDIVPPIVAAAPEALLLAVTDPPDPVADVSRRIAGHDRLLSSGTFLDSLRFQFHLGKRLGVDPRSVQAQVIGEPAHPTCTYGVVTVQQRRGRFAGPSSPAPYRAGRFRRRPSPSKKALRRHRGEPARRTMVVRSA